MNNNNFVKGRNISVKLLIIPLHSLHSHLENKTHSDQDSTLIV